MSQSLFLKQTNGLQSFEIKPSYQCKYRDTLINFNNNITNNIILLPIEFDVEDEPEIYDNLYNLFNHNLCYSIKIENVPIIKSILSFLLC